MESILGAVSITLIVGVFFAYVLDRGRLPPFLGFFLAGAVVGKLLGLTMPDVYLQVLISLVAFEVGRQLGGSGLSPAAFFAVILEAALIVGFAIALLHAAGFTTLEGLVASVMMFSSSSVLAYRFSQALPPQARDVALSLTALEDAVLFFALSLLAGGTSLQTLPVNIVLLIAMSLAALVVFTYVYRFIIGREYALPFALAASFGFVYVVQQLQVASPFVGAFIGGYLFSRADVHKVHEKEASALSGLILYLYMLVVGVFMPAPRPTPVLMLLGLASALFAILIRSSAVFLSSLLVTGNPRTSTNVALSTAHLSELSLTVPIVANKMGLLKDPALAFALTTSPVITLFISPLLWNMRGRVEDLVARRVKELRSAVAYEKLYKVVTHAFLTASKLALLALLIALLIAYLGPLSAFALVPVAYFLYKYAREIYRDLLIALRELGGARYASALVLISVFALATYVALALLIQVAEAHVYTAAVAVAALIYTLYALYRDLRAEPAD
ncbi:MAG: cation:proton antiporter [Pyrobaculum sp.]